MYQVQWLSAEDRLHGGYLWFGLEDAAFLAVADVQHHSLSHTQPPESFFQEAECAVPALMTQVMVTSIYRCLSL